MPSSDARARAIATSCTGSTTAARRSVARIRRSSRIEPRRSAPVRVAPYSDAPRRSDPRAIRPGSWASWKSASASAQSSRRLFLRVADRNETSAPWHWRHEHVSQRGVGQVDAGEPAADELGPVDLGIAPEAVGEIAALEPHVGEGEPLEVRAAQIGVAQPDPLEAHVAGARAGQATLRDVQVGVRAVVGDLEIADQRHRAPGRQAGGVERRCLPWSTHARLRRWPTSALYTAGSRPQVVCLGETMLVRRHGVAGAGPPA